VRLQTVCVRHDPGGASADEVDAHTLGWARRVNESGVAYLTPAQLDDRWMVRVSIGAESTTRRDVEDAWAAMRSEAEDR
jgi:aromatic-L-amino-acid decarboxylase